MAWLGITDHLPYLILWGVGLAVWGQAFWLLRKRGGPITFVERQIAHGWAGGIIGSISTFLIEWMGGWDVLALSPILAVLAGMIFLVKASTLSGSFYLTAAAFFVTAVLMAFIPPTLLERAWGVVLFGLVSATAFFVPGLKYYRQRAGRLAR
jgi:serine/threonine-protein kinase